MAARRLSTRGTKERQVSNHRKHSSGVSGSGSCVRWPACEITGHKHSRLPWAGGSHLGRIRSNNRYHFVNFDDDLYVYNTPAIQSGLTLKGIAAAFISQHAHNWHPLTTISHMLDCQLYSLNAGGHHATNVILHTIAVLLLFWVLQQMTGAPWKSALVAALFAVHPLHVESVAWVSERKDILSAVFFFLMLNAYNRYARAPSVMRYLAVAVLFAAGLMSKPMLVSAPIILLLLDYWPLRRFEQPSLIIGKTKISECDDQRRIIRRLYLEKIPLFVLVRRRLYPHIYSAKAHCRRYPAVAVLCGASRMHS